MKSSKPRYQAPKIRTVAIDLTDSVLQDVDSQGKPIDNPGDIGSPRKQSIWQD